MTEQYKPNCCTGCTFVDECFSETRIKCADYEIAIKEYDRGLAEGRKEKWHDLRKNPNDLPKCSENEQVIFYVQEYCIDKYINHFCLGFYKKSFLSDDVKLFVERSKGYECEHSTEEVLRWCELPKFME